MATKKQIEALKRNAQFSTGPKTEAGRQTISHNATTHGLRSASAVVLPTEQQEFDCFAASLYEEWRPEGATDRIHWERMLHCAWRLKRITRIATSVLLEMCQKPSGQAEESSLGSAYTNRMPILSTLSRHERQIERSFRQAYHEMELQRYAGSMDFSPFYVRHLRGFPAPGEVRRK